MYNPALRSNFPAPQAAAAETADLVGLNDITRFLRRSYRTILIAMVSSAAVGLAFCLVVTPTFTGTAQVLIEADHIQSFFQDTSIRPDSDTETGRIESQIEVIKSDRITEAVIRTLKLLDDPEFSPPDDPPFYAPLTEAIKALVKPAEPPPTDEEIRTARQNRAVERFADRLGVRRVGQSFVAEVQFRSNDAAKAATITNTLLGAYIDADIEAKAANARRGNVWLTERLTDLRTQVSESRRAVEEFKASGAFRSSSERAVKLAELESMSQSQSRLYDVFLQRLTETAQKITYPVADARIIATAAKPLTRSFPRTGLIVAFTSLLGAALGVGFALMRNSADHTIRSARRLGPKLGTTVLGVVAARKARNGRSKSGLSPDLIPMPGRPVRAFATDLRALKVAVNAALAVRPVKRLGVTAIGCGEGKTMIAINLAALFACSGSRVLLIDLCDGSRCLGGILAPQATHGLSEAIRSPDVLPRLLVQHPGIETLFVLPRGRAEGPASPAERLAAKRHRPELDALGQTFDLILFDMPGIGTSPDALAIAPLLDAAIVVVEYGRSTVDDLDVTLTRLAESRTDILGVVVNKADPKRMED